MRENFGYKAVTWSYHVRVFWISDFGLVGFYNNNVMCPYKKGYGMSLQAVESKGATFAIPSAPRCFAILSAR